MKVLVCDSISPRAVERMRTACLDVDVRDKITPEELLVAIGDYDAMVVRSRTKVRKPVLRARYEYAELEHPGLGGLLREFLRERGLLHC